MNCKSSNALIFAITVIVPAEAVIWIDAHLVTHNDQTIWEAISRHRLWKHNLFKPWTVSQNEWTAIQEVTWAPACLNAPQTDGDHSPSSAMHRSLTTQDRRKRETHPEFPTSRQTLSFLWFGLIQYWLCSSEAEYNDSEWSVVGRRTAVGCLWLVPCSKSKSRFCMNIHFTWNFSNKYQIDTVGRTRRQLD